MWTNKESAYKLKPEDEMGIFFTIEEFPELADNFDDVSGVLQAAIARLVKEQYYGILYIPEGEYRIKKTVKIPPSVRLIGYGEKRPVFVLPEDAEGFDGADADREFTDADRFLNGYPGANYMLWFIGESDLEKENPRDANAGTFYSALSNIDFRIEGTHRGAICIRAHFAQHGFINHCHFDLGNGLAGLFDVGNEMENLTFEGGDYAIVCRMTSPGWPFAMFDSCFFGQKKAAILTSTTGFTGFRLHIANTPRAFGLYMEDSWEKLYLEDCLFENIYNEAITFNQDRAVIQQTNIKNLVCKNVPNLVKKIQSNRIVTVAYASYLVEEYIHGYIYDDSDSGKDAKIDEVIKVHPMNEGENPTLPRGDIPELPDMNSWVSARKYGAVGDGKTDDTRALQAAFDSEDVVFLPQGIYKVSDTVSIRNNTVVIGMSPITTQIVIEDDEPAFSGFGTPKAIVSVEKGVRVIFNGIGIDTAGKNPRAVGVRWAASEDSYMNDVKLMGGHGNMYRDGRNPYACLYNPSRTGDYDVDRLWDYQYASLWITDNGGGVFKDIWSASPYAEAGISITNTYTKGKMYAISLEHHVRHEIKLNNVANWDFYALQTEEEKAEGLECLPMSLVNCRNISVVNYFLFRVVAVNKSYENGIKLWNCKNILFRNLHNKAQMNYTFTITLKDDTTGFFAKSPEYAWLYISGNAEKKKAEYNGEFRVIAKGYDFAQGATLDDNGNLYWCDKASKTIYKYDRAGDFVIPFLDIHFIPAALSVDTQNNLLVAVDYSELRKTVPGQPFQTHDFTNFHPFFSWFYKRSEKMYAVNLNDPYNTMTVLEKKTAKEISPGFVVRPAEMDYPGMFESVAASPVSEYYIAPDGCTAIEATIDLARSLKLSKFVPGEAVCVSDDALRRTVCYHTDAKGNYSEGRVVATRGQYGSFVGSKGVIWTVDDKLYGFLNGEQVTSHEVPEDAYSIIGKGKEFFVIGRHGIYL